MDVFECKANKLAGSTGGQAKAKNRTSRNVANVANLPNVANVANSTYEYEYEYDKPHSPDKEKNILNTTYLDSSIEEIKCKRMFENVPKPSERLNVLPMMTLHPTTSTVPGHIEMEIRTGSMTAHFDDEGTVTAL